MQLVPLRNGFLSVREFSKLITRVFPAMKSSGKPELNYMMQHMSTDLRYVRSAPEGGVPEVAYGGAPVQVESSWTHTLKDHPASNP
jgi:hypothetical protein